MNIFANEQSTENVSKKKKSKRTWKFTLKNLFTWFWLRRYERKIKSKKYIEQEKREYERREAKKNAIINEWFVMNGIPNIPNGEQDREYIRNYVKAYAHYIQVLNEEERNKK